MIDDILETGAGQPVDGDARPGSKRAGAKWMVIVAGLPA